MGSFSIFTGETLRLFHPPAVNPCSKIHCGAGKVCEKNGTTATCVCIAECPEQLDPRYNVCTNLNETWSSDCEVHRQRCLCNTHDDRCRSHELKHVQVEYLGVCRKIPVRERARCSSGAGQCLPELTGLIV